MLLMGMSPPVALLDVATLRLAAKLCQPGPVREALLRAVRCHDNVSHARRYV